MSEIDFAAVMTALAAIPVDAGILERSYDWPTPDINPPCLIAGYPEGPQPFDATMVRGHDRATFPIWVVVGAFDRRSTRDRMAPYLLPIKAAIEAATAFGEAPASVPVPWSSARVQSWGIEPFAVEGSELLYSAIKFDVDVLT